MSEAAHVSRRPQILGIAATLAVLAAACAFAAAAQQSTPSVAGSSSDASAGTSAALSEVTVRARKGLRAELAPKISKFVTEIVAPENGGEGGLARWEELSVCPLVSGLPAQEGDFILGRVSEIARVAPCR
jgi:hypothetical protein